MGSHQEKELLLQAEWEGVIRVAQGAAGRGQLKWQPGRRAWGKSHLQDAGPGTTGEKVLEPVNKGDEGVLIWMAECSASEASNYACPDTAGPLAAVTA